MPERLPSLQGPEAFARALANQGTSLRERYKGDPEGLAERLGLKLPQKPLQVMRELGLYDPEKHGPITPGLRDLVLDVCLGRVRSAVAVANRGGGKSQGVSFIEFYLWIIELYDALNLGGSELQASNVYDYLLSYIESDPYWRSLLKDNPKISESWTRENAWIRVLTASQKSVRSPHAGGVKRDGRVAGGLLVIDEEAEADPAIVHAALPTINTARPSVNVRCSTFHNAEGTFAEVIDNHDEMGYKLYQWDIFDVAQPCACTGEGCQSEEKCFREDHFEEYTDPEDGQVKRRMMHKAYCGGRSKYADGWMPQEEIVTMWRRMKRNHAQWEVEAMGSRPSVSGHVIKDLKRFAENVKDVPASDFYIPGLPITVCVDWGFVAAGLCVWQEQPGDVHALLHADLIEEAGQTQIFGNILGYWTRYTETVEIAADSAGGGQYLNPKLREEERLPVREVQFAQEKEAAVAAWNILNEAEKLRIPAEFEDFRRQVRNWRRKNGIIQKGNDHLCDASICYFSKFVGRLGVSNIRILPRSFSALPGGPDRELSPVEQRRKELNPPRVPIVRGLGARS